MTTLHQRCADIEWLVLDVDGVLTDGRIIYTDRGEEVKAFHVRDGAGVKWWTEIGKHAAIITGRRSAIVERRAAELGVRRVIQGVSDKHAALRTLLADFKVDLRCVCAIGDDLADLGVLRACGLAVAVADACTEAKEDAHYVTQAGGGRGAVRETIELILRAQGIWSNIVERSRTRE